MPFAFAIQYNTIAYVRHLHARTYNIAAIIWSQANNEKNKSNKNEWKDHGEYKTKMKRKKKKS